MSMYPIFLNLESARCLVLGGGAVAFRKVRSLIAASAAVTVIAPETSTELRTLAESGAITWLPRPYRPGDLRGARLVIAATDSRDVNRAVYDEATALGIPVNSVDDPENSSFFVPAVARRGELALAVSTGGAAPYLARRLREYLESKLYPGIENDVERLRAERARLAEKAGSFDEKKRLAESELEPLVREIIRRMEEG